MTLRSVHADLRLAAADTAAEDVCIVTVAKSGSNATMRRIALTILGCEVKRRAEASCREYAEKEVAKRMEGARATWAALLRAIFTRLGLQDANEAPRTSTKGTPRKKSSMAAAAKHGSEAVSM